MDNNTAEVAANAMPCESTVSREFIYDILTEWFNGGQFTTTTKIKSEVEKFTTSTIESLCVKRRLSYTSMQKVLFVGDKTRHPAWELFQRYYNEKRIMTPLEAKVQLNISSLHLLHKAVESGKLMRFEYSDVIIYIR